MAKLLAVHPVLTSRDLERTRIFYAALGFRQIFCDCLENPRYLGMVRDGVEIHFQWHDPNEWMPGIDRATYRFLVKNVDGMRVEFVNSGINTCTKIEDQPWGCREFHLLDPDRNGLQFYQDLPRP